MPGPLEGIRVLELTQIIAGPFCGVNLADLGADVVKIEAPGGDGMRVIGAFMPGESKAFHALNRGKRSIVMDLQLPKAREAFYRMIRDTDVFVINPRPGVPERLGIDYDSLRKHRPDLIYLQSTGYGTVGPNAERSGSDVVAQAFSGLMAGEGKLDEWGAPAPVSCAAIADFSTGFAAAMSVCAALYRRATTGEGEFIQTSLLQSALAIQTMSVSKVPVVDAITVDPMIAQVHAVRDRGGSYAEMLSARSESTSRLVGRAFTLYYSGYSARDGGLILGALTPQNRNQMRRVLGITDDPSASPDFNALDPAMVEPIEAIRARIRDTIRQKTVAEWLALFDAEGAPISAVNFPEDMADDPQVEALEQMLEFDHPMVGPIRLVGPVSKMRDHPTGSPLPPPPLAAHTDEVLSGYGFSPADIATLRDTGAVQ